MVKIKRVLLAALITGAMLVPTVANAVLDWVGPRPPAVCVVETKGDFSKPMACAKAIKKFEMLPRVKGNRIWSSEWTLGY